MWGKCWIDSDYICTHLYIYIYIYIYIINVIYLDSQKVLMKYWSLGWLLILTYIFMSFLSLS
ncbi:MAG: hypothetical protein N7Q72_04805, partial [Spiroplasma sp. Tabriz.8]|nr:hypothetical protein [Spiroplasma sp. Tabriz.8]